MSAVVLTVVGARPQFIKCAAVTRELIKSGGLREVVVHTGQHSDDTMSKVFFDELGIPKPAYNLGIHGLTHGAMTGRMLEAVETVILAEKPDAVLVYGDTNSTAAAALAASKLSVPIAHVEAGLRSFNRKMPEEINRVVTDHLATFLFCPTRSAVINLEAEGIREGVFHVGDVMYDIASTALAEARSRSRILEQLDVGPKAYALATIHRAENTSDAERFSAVMAWIGGQRIPVVMPMHPRTKALVSSIPPNVRVVDPLGYHDMQLLTSSAASVFTDSGGLQKEAYFYRVPCVTLRDETEWTETIEAGWNRLWTEQNYKPRRDIHDFGNGRAGAAIVEILKEKLGAKSNA